MKCSPRPSNKESSLEQGLIFVLGILDLSFSTWKKGEKGTLENQAPKSATWGSVAPLESFRAVQIEKN